jgi:glycosyltransferase involved in cell wall biosynthesis
MTKVFLSVMTRCFKRPILLQENIKSLKSQTIQDYEQILIIDKIGYGLAVADKALNENKKRASGKFIMVLDDDDKIIESKFIEILKEIDIKINPDVIIWQGYFSQFKTALPELNEFWGNKIYPSHIGSFNYCVCKSLFDQYISICNSGIRGDFDFIDAIFKHKPMPKIHWIPMVMVATQLKGRGQPVTKVENRGRHTIIRKN